MENEEREKEIVNMRLKETEHSGRAGMHNLSLGRGSMLLQ